MKPLRAISLALVLLALWAVPAMGAQPAQTDNVDCTDFEFQEDAQFAMNQDTGDPTNLDEDGDGVACENLPKFTSTLPEGTPGCSGFDSLAEAQAYLDAADPPGSRRHMDRDRDGVACEETDFSEPPPVLEPGRHPAKPSVTVTFRLILYGEAVEGQTFAANLGYLPDPPGSGPHPSFLCGRFTPTIGGPEVYKPCKGGGTVFTATRQVMVGQRFWYGFYYEPRSASVNIGSGESIVSKDTTFEASYTFPKGAGEMPDELPDTGAGGLAPGAAIPVGNAAAGLAMLVGAGYAVIRRR